MLRREYLKRAGAFSAAGTAAGLAGCTGGGGSPDKLTLGTWGGTWQDLMIKAVVDSFKKENDVKVNYVLGNDDPRLSKIIAQKKNPPVDVSQQDGSSLVKGTNAGVWLPLTEDLVPTMSEIPEVFRGENDTWLMQIFAASGLLYNPNVFDSAPGWGAYLDTKYKGKVGLFTEDPTHDLLAFSLYKSGGKSFKAIDKAFEMYKEVVETMDPVYITSSEEYGKHFASKNIVLGRYWSARAAQWNSEGKPVTSTIPKEGAMTTNFGNAIPKNISEEKQKLAGKFIDMTLQQQAGKVIARNMYYTNPNPNVSYPEDIADKLVQKEDLEKLKMPDFDWIASNRESWVQRMSEIINSNK